MRSIDWSLLMKSFVEKTSAIFQLGTVSMGIFTPWTFLISAIVAFTLFFGVQCVNADLELDKIVETLFQVTVMVFGINVIGITINHGLELNWKTASSVLQQIEISVPKVFSFHDHWRTSKLKRKHFVEFQCCYVGIPRLKFQNDINEDDFYIYRPHSDGAWYQWVHSPFAEFEPEGKRWPIAIFHESVICAFRLLHTIIEMQKSGCCLVPGNGGTQGSRWFMEDLKEISEKVPEIRNGKPPAELDTREAIQILNLALYSSHYLEDEIRKQSAELNWTPKELAEFSVFYVEAISWLTYLTGKLQLLRVANIEARKGFSSEQFVEKIFNRLGNQALQDVVARMNELHSISLAEYGIANRFWQLKRAAVSGMGAAILYFVLTVIALPIFQIWGDDQYSIEALSLVYFFGIFAMLESINFTFKMIWLPKTISPIKPTHSRPPGSSLRS